MKKSFIFLAMLILAGLTAMAQAPQAFNYQGVARSTTGAPLAGATLGLRLTILDGSSTGTPVYQETQTPTTNNFGLYNVTIGTGTVVSGTFSAINWGSGNKYLEVEIDPAGGTSYAPGGTNQLVTVPYAMYASTANTANSATTASSAATLTGTVTMTGDVTGNNAATSVVKIQGNAVSSAAPTAGQVLSWNSGSSSWTPSNPAPGSVTSITAGTGLSGGTITTSGTISMPAVGTAGTYGSATNIPVITTDAEGRVSAVSTIPVSAGTVTSITAGPGLSGGTITTSGSISLPTEGTAGTYGSATQVPVIITDAYGRVTSATNTAIAGPTAGSGITIVGSTINAQNTNAIWNANELQGSAISTTTPTGGQVLEWSGTSWGPATVTGVGTVTSVSAGAGLSGGVITGIGTISMPNEGTPGTYGSSTQVPVFTTDAQGRVTAVSNTTIAGSSPGIGITIAGATISAQNTTALWNANELEGNNVSATSPASGQVLEWSGTAWTPTNPTLGTLTSITAGAGLSGGTITGSGTISMPNEGTPGTYGSATQVPVITTDAQGRVTSVTNTTIAGSSAGTGITITGATISAQNTSNIWNADELQGNNVSATAPASGQVLEWSGSSWTPTTITAGTGTVTSITAGAGLTGGVITGSGTIAMPNVGTSGTYGSATQVPVFNTDPQGRITSVTNTAIALPTVSGTTNYISKFTAATAIGNSQVFDNGTSVGIGTTTPLATNKLQVTNASTASNATAIQGIVGGVATTTITTPAGVYGESNSQIGVVGVSTGGDGSVGLSTVSGYGGVVGENTSAGGFGVYGTVSDAGDAGYFDGGTLGNGVIVPNGFSGFGATTPEAMLHVQGSKDVTVTLGGLTFNHQAIIGQTATTSTSNVSNAIIGSAENSTFENHGLFGLAAGSGASYNVGAFCLAEPTSTTTGNSYGVFGNAMGGAANYGVYAEETGAGYAGYFSGNVWITGSVAKGSGTFKIDHPLDPENKYLYHSFVESPDMMNIYNGNVVTDATGTATVTLPDYFDALNKDFRYQLTTIGQPAQVYVSKEISDNQFEVKSDKPNVKISWMVTGVRQDKYANAHRVVPEVEKEPEFKGYYIHAAEWGQPDSKSINAVTRPKYIAQKGSTSNTSPEEPKQPAAGIQTK